MRTRSRWILLPLFALLALAALAPAAGAANSQSGAGSLLYVQQMEGGSLRHLDSGGFALRLTGVSPRLSTFTDRPRRRAGSQGLRKFLSGWGKAGFAADPPNAALVLDRAARSRDVAMLTLSHPRYNRRHQTLTYRVKPLHGKGAGALAAFAKRGDRVRAGNFGSASLFVDNGAEEVGYATISVTVNNMTPGQPFQLSVSPGGDGRVEWNIPLRSPGYEAVQLSGQGSAIPLTGLAVNSEAIVLDTAPEGPNLNFQMSATVEVEGTDAVLLTAKAPPGALITVSWPTNTGPMFQEMVPGDLLELNNLET